MILSLPKHPANDNPEREVWACYACECAAFILSCVNDVTTIHCQSCNVDVTPYVIPTIKFGPAGEANARD